MNEQEWMKERKDSDHLRKTSQLYHGEGGSLCREVLGALSLQGMCKNIKNTIDPTKAGIFHEVKERARLMRSWSPEHFNFIDGLRVLALMWAILAVVYAETRVIPSDNSATAIPNFFSNFFFTALVPGAVYSTDIFLFFSGFLSTYQILSIARTA